MLNQMEQRIEETRPMVDQGGWELGEDPHEELPKLGNVYEQGDGRAGK